MHENTLFVLLKFDLSFFFFLHVIGQWQGFFFFFLGGGGCVGGTLGVDVVVVKIPSHCNP